MSNSPKYAKAVAMIKRIINLIFLFIPRAAKIPWAEGIIVSDVRGPLTHRMPLFCRAASWEWCTLNGNGTKRRFYSALSAMRHLCIVQESWPVVIAPLARATTHSLSLSLSRSAPNCLAPVSSYNCSWTNSVFMLHLHCNLQFPPHSAVVRLELNVFGLHSRISSIYPSRAHLYSIYCRIDCNFWATFSGYVSLRPWGISL